MGSDALSETGRPADRAAVPAREPPPGVRGAHLVGSMPLADSAAVFKFAEQHLGSHLKRIPDGETGARINWTQWQHDVFAAVPALTSEIFDAGYLKRPKFRLKPGAQAEDVRFPPLGYAKAAKASYQVFRSLKKAGTIRQNVRFQVCLPTPIAPIVIFVFPEDQLKLEPRYEAAMLAELEDIVAAVPAAELAVQWDTAIEFAILEGVLPHALANPEAEIILRLVRLGDYVPEPVELGFHLCYGDSGGRHFKEPGDTSKLVSVANGISRGLTRSLDWLHLPVPKERTDPAYYRALGELRLQPDTELYLGLVHASDGVEGAKRRIGSAARYVSRFGVATECGCGRQKTELLAGLMNIHAEISRPVHA
jgi:hypothetical protein